MRKFDEWLADEAKKVLPPPKDTGFWTDKFGDEKVDNASVDDLFAHAKKFPGGLLAGIRSLQLLVNYGTFPKSKVKALWAKYKGETKKEAEDALAELGDDAEVVEE